MPISYMRYLNMSMKKRSQLFQGKRFVKKINICLGERGIGVIFLWEVSAFCEYFTNFVVINSYGTMVLSCSHMQIKREI